MDHLHAGHGDAVPGDDGPMCQMSMLFTWSTEELCIVFKWWHIRSTPGLIISLLAVVLLTAMYEALRSATRRYELFSAKQAEDLPRRNQVEVSKRAHVVKAALYAVQTFYAFMLMLLFMTYNGWVMLSVGVGAFVGYLIFGNNLSSARDGACH